VNPERALCAGILLRAFHDAERLAGGVIPEHILGYPNQRTMKKPDLLNWHRAEVDELVEFVNSEWFQVLCDGAAIDAGGVYKRMMPFLKMAKLAKAVHVPRTRRSEATD